MTNRRTFLRSTAAMTAGLGLSGTLPLSAFSRSGILGANDKITVALIGARNMGWYDLTDLLKQSNVECKTLCDVDDAVLAEKGISAGGTGTSISLCWKRITGKCWKIRTLMLSSLGLPITGIVCRCGGM